MRVKLKLKANPYQHWMLLCLKRKESRNRDWCKQAINLSEQGKTGWYVDASGEITKWEVTDDGWNRLR